MLFKRQLAEMKKRLDELYDAQIRQRRMLADILYNLDEENMPVIKEIIERYKSESADSIASVKASADENGARISALAGVQREHTDSIAKIEQEASEDRASITLAVERSNAALDTASEAKNDAKNGASIILAVNSDSSGARISADKIVFEGVAAFVRPEQLDGTDGVEQTTIDAGNIKTGKLSAEHIDAEGLSVGSASGGSWTMKKDRLTFNGPLSEDAWIGFDGIFFSANGASMLEIDRKKLSSSIRSANAFVSLAPQSISVGVGEDNEVLGVSRGGGELCGVWSYGGSELATKADIEALRDEFGTYGGEEPVEQVDTPTISPPDSVYMFENVTISCSTPGALICYTVSMENSGESWSGEGSYPSVDVKAYTDGVDVMHVSAYATKEGMLDSDTVTASIVVNA